MKNNRLLKMFVEDRINHTLYIYICNRITPKGSRTKVEPKSSMMWMLLIFISIISFIALIFINKFYNLMPKEVLMLILPFILVLIFIFSIKVVLIELVNRRFYGFYDDLVSILGENRFWNLLSIHPLSYDDILLSVKKCLISKLSGLICFERNSLEFRNDLYWEAQRSNLNKTYTKAVFRFPELKHEKGWGQFMKEAEKLLEEEAVSFGPVIMSSP